MGSSKMLEAPPLIDLGNCPDMFCSGIARIEKLGGGNLRFVIFAEHSGESSNKEHHVVANMIVHISIVPAAIRQVMLAIADTPFVAENGQLAPIH